MKQRHCRLLFVLLSVLSGNVRADMLDEGIAAARRTDYVTALKIFTPLRNKEVRLRNTIWD
jgi:hypothetical protein